ncbi:MAG: hypothetical protein L3K14_08935 [Thermoplasmata archaeon]|nr:hypothetical protein [Thermoplasmata archaeon]
MPEALVQSGRWLRWVAEDGRIVDERAVESNPGRAGELLASGLEGVPPTVEAWVRVHVRAVPLLVSDLPLHDWLTLRGIPSELLGAGERRRVREASFQPDRAERALLLSVARHRLQRAMRAPEATLAALAREEERVQRVLRREVNAADSWVSVGAPALSEYARVSLGTREQIVRHLRELTNALEEQARKVAPNLSVVVGPVVAAHLIAAAGGLEPLSRMNSSRIQLLGARRRFGPGRTPRFGILYHTEGMSRVPPARSGAFARSAAGLAAIAARADATTGRTISTELVRRRDRRIAQLRGRGP